MTKSARQNSNNPIILLLYIPDKWSEIVLIIHFKFFCEWALKSGEITLWYSVYQVLLEAHRGLKCV